jgi:rubredoxin
MKQPPNIQQLEAFLRTSAIVAGGFMGADPRPLIEIIETDIAELAMLDTTPAQLGHRMAEISRQAVAGLGTPVAVAPGLEAVAEESRGILVCPWRCHDRASKTVTTVSRADGIMIRWSDLSAHMIAAHGFFQGHGAAYRLEPREAVSVLFHTKEITMDQYICQACGYIYDPNKGEKASNIPPKTTFEQVPDAWKCPMCGAPKRMFKKKK